MINAVHRGYTNNGFEAWTVPCLYVVGNHLRAFAVRADEERTGAANYVGEASFQDDFDADSEKNQQLEDCARQLNRLFQLCLSDRTQDLANSRKWGIYGLINLLFKTYFKLNSASLSRNILRALAAYKGDMPGLDRFPKSQRVTFKYYEGVVYFLEENYAEVSNSWRERNTKLPPSPILVFEKQIVLTGLTSLPTRQRNTSQRRTICATSMPQETRSAQ